MTKNDYLNILVEQIHSVVVATIGSDGLPQTRVIDMMLQDSDGVYFLTAKGKAFYSQLEEQKFVAISASKGKIAVSLRGKVKKIGKKNLDLIFEKNPYMKEIYPGETRAALEVFQIYQAQGEYFDISVPSKIFRDSFQIGTEKILPAGYFISSACTLCKKCAAVCPQNCIDFSAAQATINQNRCLHCGRCAEICPAHCIEKRT